MIHRKEYGIEVKQWPVNGLGFEDRPAPDNVQQILDTEEKSMPYKAYKFLKSTISILRFILLEIERKKKFNKLKKLARQRGINHEDSRVSYL